MGRNTFGELSSQRRQRRQGLAALFLVGMAAGMAASCAPVTRLAPIAPAGPLPVSAPDTQGAAERFAEAIRIPTRSDLALDVELPAAGVERPNAFDRFNRWLEETYPAAHGALERENVAGYSLLYTWPGSEPGLRPVVLKAHIDVVPADGDGWKVPPFAGVIRDGFVWGRGTLDNKGNLVAMMEAVEALAKKGFRPRRTVHLAFGHDEETTGSGAAAIARRLEARGLPPAYVLDEGPVILTDFPLTEVPVALIGTAEKGYLTVEVRARGQEGSSAAPSGQLAIYKLARAIRAIEKSPFDTHLQRGPVVDMFHSLKPDLPPLLRFAVSNLWLTRPLIKWQLLAADPRARSLLATTIAPTMLAGAAQDNVLPPVATAHVNLRLHPRETSGQALAHLREAVAHIDGVTVRAVPETLVEPSPVSSLDTPAGRMLTTLIRQQYPEATVAPTLVIGATDSRHYVTFAEDVYRFSPVVLSTGEVETMHGSNERLSVANLERMIEFYARLLVRSSDLSDGTEGTAASEDRIELERP